MLLRTLLPEMCVLPPTDSAEHYACKLMSLIRVYAKSNPRISTIRLCSPACAFASSCPPQLLGPCTCPRPIAPMLLHTDPSPLCFAPCANSFFRYYYILLALTVLYAVFENDVKRAALPIEADLPLEIAITVILVLYALEMSE